MKLILLGLLLSFSAQALEITIEWDAVTARENGDSLPLEEIGGYRVYSVADTYPEEGGVLITDETLVQEVPNTSTTMIVYNPEYWGTTTANFIVTAFDTDGLESRGSNKGSISLLKLKPPVLLKLKWTPNG